MDKSLFGELGPDDRLIKMVVWNSQGKMLISTMAVLPAVTLEVSVGGYTATASGDRPLPWKVEVQATSKDHSLRPPAMLDAVRCKISVGGKQIADITVHDTGLEDAFTMEVQQVCAALVWAGLRSACGIGLTRGKNIVDEGKEGS